MRDIYCLVKDNIASKVKLKVEPPDQADEVREHGRMGPIYWKNCQVQGLMARILTRLLKLEIYLMMVRRYENAVLRTGRKHISANCRLLSISPE